MIADIKACAAKALVSAMQEFNEDEAEGANLPQIDTSDAVVERLAGKVVDALLAMDADSSSATTTGGDPVHPAHYKGDFVMRLAEAFNLNACTFNVVKYVLRHGTKAGLTDLKKSRWYLDREIENQEKPAGLWCLSCKVAHRCGCDLHCMLMMDGRCSCGDPPDTGRRP